jgi:hypothetical protein
VDIQVSAPDKWHELIEEGRARSRALSLRYTDTCPQCGMCDPEGWAECKNQERDDEYGLPRCIKVDTVDTAA